LSGVLDHEVVLATDLVAGGIWVGKLVVERQDIGAGAVLVPNDVIVGRVARGHFLELAVELY